jgi:tetratricopeptide (TPR) repeat protein
LRAQKDLPTAIDAYKKALAIEPKYAKAWINLGVAFYDQKDIPAAIDAYKKALAIETTNALAWNNLGNALYAQKHVPGAIDAYNKALALDPKFAKAWYNLGIALQDQKDLPGAIDAYKKVLAIDSKLAKVWYNLGVALQDQNDLPGAIDAYKKALGIDPKLADAWYNLGSALGGEKNLPAAIGAYKTAIKINPRDPKAQGALGMALRDKGDFAEAAAYTQRALQLLPKGHPLRPFVERQLKHCEQLLALEHRLLDALKGEPIRPAGYLALADLCQRYKERYRDAADLYGKAFAGDPKLAELRGNRYNAACAAALAAGGKGVGAANLFDKEKSRLRQQALGWLRDELAAQRKLLEENPKTAVPIQQNLQHWQSDPDLAGVRDRNELARLPAAEQTAWKKLWADVAALRQKARGK